MRSKKGAIIVLICVVVLVGVFIALKFLRKGEEPNISIKVLGTDSLNNDKTDFNTNTGDFQRSRGNKSKLR